MENQTTGPKVHGSAACNPNRGRPVLRILVEREMMTPRMLGNRAIWRDDHVFRTKAAKSTVKRKKK
jgi:hypothetical protein